MPIDPAQPPDEKAVRDYYEHLRKTWEEARALFAKLDTFYFRTYNVWPTDKQFTDRPSHRPSTPTWIVDHAADTQLGTNPVIHRPVAGRGVDHEAAADRLETGLSALINDAFLQEPVIPVKGAKKQLLLYGYTPIYGPFLDMRYQFEEPTKNKGEEREDFEARLSEWEARRFGWNPLRTRVLHPNEVLLEPFDKIPGIGLRNHKILAHELADLTSRRFETLSKTGTRSEYATEFYNKEPYELIEVIEWWTASWHAVVQVDGKLLYRERNGWGFQPLSHTFSSYGQIPTKSDRVNPRDLAKGILEPNLDEIVHEAQQQTAKHELLIRAAFAKRGYRGDATEAAEMLKGDILEGEESDWWTEKIPNLPGQMFELGRETQVAIQRGSFSLALAGYRQEGVSTVGQQAILDAAAKNKFRSIELVTDHLFSINASNMLRLTDVLSEAVGLKSLSIGGQELRVEDIHHNYRIAVEFRDVDPVLLQQQIEIALREYQAGLISDVDYYRATGKEDATGFMKRRIQERLRQTPEYMAVAGRFLAREMGLRQLGERLGAQNAQAAAGGQPGAQPGAQPGQAAPGGQLVGPNGQPISSPGVSPENPMAPGQIARQQSNQLANAMSNNGAV